jgi:hypothetical protein
MLARARNQSDQVDLVAMGIQDLVVGQRKRNQGLGQMSGASVQDNLVLFSRIGHYAKP